MHLSPHTAAFLDIIHPPTKPKTTTSTYIIYTRSSHLQTLIVLETTFSSCLPNYYSHLSNFCIKVITLTKDDF
jgi:hypothetical protein